MMVSPKAAKEAGDKFGQKPVCAGPFKFVERVQQDRIVLEKFADYWDKANVHIDRIIYRADRRLDGAAREPANRASSTSSSGRSRPTSRTCAPTSSLKVATITELGYQGITINVGKGEAAKNPLGQDPRVRRAFELAIDRDALNQVVYNGEYTVGNQWVSPKNP